MTAFAIVYSRSLLASVLLGAHTVNASLQWTYTMTAALAPDLGLRSWRNP